MVVTMPRMATLCSDHTRSPGLQAGAEPLQDLLKVLWLRYRKASHCRQRSRNGVGLCLQAGAEPLQDCLLWRGGALPALQQKGRILCWHCHALQELGTRMQQYKSRSLAYPACAWQLDLLLLLAHAAPFAFSRRTAPCILETPTAGNKALALHTLPHQSHRCTAQEHLIM